MSLNAPVNSEKIIFSVQKGSEKPISAEDAVHPGEPVTREFILPGGIYSVAAESRNAEGVTESWKNECAMVENGKITHLSADMLSEPANAVFTFDIGL